VSYPVLPAAQEGDLLIAWTGERRKRDSLILPHLEGSPVERLVARLSTRPEVRTRILRPPKQSKLSATAAWHADAWMALPEIARKGGAVLAGPSAMNMRGISARIVFVTSPPGDIELPPKHISQLLRGDDARGNTELSGIVNRQGRLLLRDVEKLGNGRRVSNQKLRNALGRVELTTVDRLPEVAKVLANTLGLDPSQAAREATDLLESFETESRFDALPTNQRERLIGLNWLDSALWKLARVQEDDRLVGL
jgi:hypothetical protein